MRKLTCWTATTTIAAAFVLVLAGATPSRAQEQPAKKTPYFTIAYMKALPGKAADALSLERAIWAPVHQELVRTGKLDFWRVYSCRFPSGSETEYEYVTINQYPTWTELEEPYSSITPATFARIHPKMKVGELVTRTEAVRKMVRQDVFSLELATTGWPGAKTDVLDVVYMKAQPGRAGELAEIQKNHILPLNEELVRQGQEAAWGSALLRFPYAASAPYDSIAFNGFATLAAMGSYEAPEAFKAKAKEVSVRLNAVRVRVRNQLWIYQCGTQPK
jgi:hypothetical protein